MLNTLMIILVISFSSCSQIKGTKTCRVESYERGAGYPLSVCPENYEKNGLLSTLNVRMVIV